MSNTQKITYTASLTAVAFVMLLISHFLPLSSVLPLLIAALVLYYCISKCGLVWGIISAGISVLLGYFAAPTVVIAYGLIFVPYAFINFGMSKLKNQSKIIVTVIRYIILLVFFNAALWGVYRLSAGLFGMSDIVDKLWGLYPVFAAIMSLVFVVYDIAFGMLYTQLVRRKIFR